VAFSWWGVNLLSVGLHSYGFTSGISVALNVYYGLSLLVVVAALVWRIADRRAERAAGAAASANT
jgi:hypothetical protein